MPPPGQLTLAPSTSLAPPQWATWLLDQLVPEVTASSVARFLQLPGVDSAAVAQALVTAVAAHPALAVACGVVDGQPVAMPAAPLELRHIAATAHPGLLADLADAPFDLATGPLLRAIVFEGGLLLVASELVADSDSLGLLLRDLAVVLSGNEPEPDSGAPPDRAESASWWAEKLRSLPGSLDLPVDCARPARSSYSGSRFVRRLDASLIGAADALADRLGTCRSNVFLAAYSALLNRLSSQDDLVIGVPTRRGDARHAVGPWSPVLPLRIDMSADPSLLELVGTVRDLRLRVVDFADIPADLLGEIARPLGGAVTEPLTAALFEDADDGLPGTPVFAGRSSARTDLALVTLPTGLGWEHGTVFSTEAAEAIATQFERLLAAGLAAPDLPLSRAPILDDAERIALRELGSGAATGVPAWRVPERIAEWAAEHGSAVAASSDGLSISYADLVARSRQLASVLRASGVGPGSLVGVCLDRTADLLVAFLGVWWTGAAYVPVDPGYPPERVAMIFEDASVAAVVSQVSASSALPQLDCPTVLLDRDAAALSAAPADDLGVRVVGHDAAYVIFTSGSTGRPKGVVIRHDALANLLAEMAIRPGLRAGDVLLGVTTPAFDLSVPDWWLPLSFGGSVHVAPPSAAADGGVLAALLEEVGADVMQATPSTWRLLLETGWGGRPDLRAVVGGEACPAVLASAIAEKVGTLYNFYGPTECTVWATCGQLTSPVDVVTLGNPLANYTVHVVDKHLAEVPIGVAGELLIGGAGLALGYFHRLDLTADRFIASPYAAGEMVYRTGDLVRWRRDGRLEFIGRIDQQVKVRGYRIELGEVETALTSHADVHQAVVVVREDEPGDKRLVAYVVGAAGLAGGTLRRHVGAVLPAYMVPTAVVILDALPQTPNGKIDRKALPAPDPDAAGETREVTMPRTPIEQALADVWSQVLGVSTIGIEDDFFSLGGHSLLVLQVASRLPDLLGTVVPLRNFFDRTTLEAQSLAVLHELLAVRMPGSMPTEGKLKSLPVERRIALESKLLLRKDSVVDDSISPRKPDDPAPVSSSQRRLWFLDQWSPGDPKYNAVIAVRLRGPLDVDRLRSAFHVVIERHEAVRTVFPADAGVPCQRVLDDWAFDIPVHDLRSVEADVRESRLVALARELSRASFDLRKDLMLRVAAVRMADDDTVLVFMEHHIAFDGWSDEVMFGELAEVYMALSEGREPALPALPVQYRDYALWQERRLTGDRLDGLTRYWHDHLDGAPAYLDMPLDKPRPAVQTFSGARWYVDLPKESADGIRALARQRGATPYMALLALFTAMLHRWSGADDICVGTPIAGRSRTELESLIGFFSNTLVLRTRPSSEVSFGQHIDAIKGVA
ncbi:MAG: amino acid adenylation domain-containing protein, partial [Pseudonocardiales bacterium]